MELLDPIGKLKGIGDKTESLFHKLGIFKIQDLIYHVPRDYERYDAPVFLSNAELQSQQTLRLFIIGNPSTKTFGKITITTFQAADESGKTELVFFNKPYIKNILQKGHAYIFRGKVSQKGILFRLENPMFYPENEYLPLVGQYFPIYPTTAGLSNKSIRKAMKQALSLTIDEFLPKDIVEQYHLFSLQKALELLHFPNNFDDIWEARQRLVFDEFLLFIVKIRTLKEKVLKKQSRIELLAVAHCQRLMEALPFSLTKSQHSCFLDIENDMESGYVMNRLIQGDVGSGKTIIAILALLKVVANGYQTAFMAPTEVLASQHYETIVSMTKKYHLPFQPVLLTGSVTAKNKAEIYQKIEQGKYNLVIGTHALIQEKVHYQSLGLVICDEQHRFGVRQRDSFSNKGDNAHVLVMSATPIPRTLAIILYGDLHVSIINEMPANRLPIKNCVVGIDYRKKAYSFMADQIKEGHQVYIICPMVEEGELDGVENVTDYTLKIRSIFPESICIKSLHGKMKNSEKNRIMEEFHDKKIDILVSTTVIEVGVNVPNATVMMVENAERFGLAQLHQLRGRVGRGESQSYCIFVSGSKSKEKIKRLEVLNHSNDGFVIAEEDMKLRGPGDLFGVRQSGALNFKVADVFQDANILEQASTYADQLLLEDYELVWQENQKIKQRIEQINLNQVDFGSI